MPNNQVLIYTTLRYTFNTSTGSQQAIEKSNLASLNLVSNALLIFSGI